MMITSVDNGITGPEYQSIDQSEKSRLIKFNKACQQFEALFIKYMLKTMRDSVDKSSLFGDGLGSDIFLQMFDEGVADKMAEAGPFGVGNMLYDTYQKIIDSKSEEAVPQKSTDMPPINKERIRFHEIDNNPKPTAHTSKLNDLEPVIQEAAKANNLKPELIKAVIMRESAGDPKAVSAKGAKGLMQLMDGTAKMLGVSDPFDIKQNIHAGSKYLANLLNKFGGDLRKALAAYNAGPSAVMKYDGIPPYQETRSYVEKIMDSLESLSKSAISR